MPRRRRPSSEPAAWLGLGMDAWLLGAEASMVMGLRMTRILRGGPAAADESRLMVAEKLGAALELQAKALTGGLGSTPLAGTAATLRHYRGKVSANRRRLERSR